ncbi:hypothetical protein F5884DRAFT_819355 [Xylogone sp. PMI_703]|nr:hypothetical protein F5884DRAFT_819355 [Xylogone sp. PMI_703]
MTKTALITGCSEGGIGDAIAQEFYRRGVRVYATARSLEKISHLNDMGIEVFELDVTSDPSTASAVETLTALTGGKLDFLVNNSGRGHTSPLLDINLQTARDTFDLNVISVLAGKIINIGSIGGGKAALNLLSESMRVEFAPLDSLYMSIASNISQTLLGELLGKGATEPSEFAKGVVANAMKESSNLWFWYGARSSIVWFITTFMPHTFLVSLLTILWPRTNELKQSGFRSIAREWIKFTTA